MHPTYRPLEVCVGVGVDVGVDVGVGVDFVWWVWLWDLKFPTRWLRVWP